MTDRRLVSQEHGTESEWALQPYITQFERDPDYVAETLALQITEEATQIMREKGITRSELATLMGVSKAYVTRILNAPPNLTLRSIAQLSLALGTKPFVSLCQPQVTATRSVLSAAESHVHQFAATDEDIFPSANSVLVVVAPPQRFEAVQPRPYPRRGVLFAPSETLYSAIENRLERSDASSSLRSSGELVRQSA